MPCAPPPGLTHPHGLEFLALPRVQTLHEHFMIRMDSGSDSDGELPELIAESSATYSDFEFSDSDVDAVEQGAHAHAHREAKGG